MKFLRRTTRHQTLAIFLAGAFLFAAAFATAQVVEEKFTPERACPGTSVQLTITGLEETDLPSECFEGCTIHSLFDGVIVAPDQTSRIPDPLIITFAVPKGAKPGKHEVVVEAWEKEQLVMFLGPLDFEVLKPCKANKSVKPTFPLHLNEGHIEVPNDAIGVTSPHEFYEDAKPSMCTACCEKGKWQNRVVSLESPIDIEISEPARDINTPRDATPSTFCAIVEDLKQLVDSHAHRTYNSSNCILAHEMSHARDWEHALSKDWDMKGEKEIEELMLSLDDAETPEEAVEKMMDRVRSKLTSVYNRALSAWHERDKNHKRAFKAGNDCLTTLRKAMCQMAKEENREARDQKWPIRKCAHACR